MMSSVISHQLSEDNTKTTTDRAGASVSSGSKTQHRREEIRSLTTIIMNALNMNTNLQSQQTRRRQQSGEKTIDCKESPKSEDASSSNNNNMMLLMHRKENNHIPISSVDRKISKNFIMAEHKNDYEGGRAPSRNDEEEQVILTPHPNDVLCGRGGSINAHVGNVVFRSWVQERRESYNLADTKSAKTRITNDIFHRVRGLEPPGRFLHKIEAPVASGDINDDVDWWTEVDDTKALAKISQALREGAPAFKAAHGKTPKSQRPSQRRRNSVPPTKKAEYQPKTRASKRRKTGSSPVELRANITSDMDISPPYYNDDVADGNLQLDVDNYDSLFNHNQIQSYKNSPYSSMGYQAAGVTSSDDNNRFDQLRPLNSHPLVNMCDYHASMTDVANAIPPTPPSFGSKRRVTSFTYPDSLPSLYAQALASPYTMQYEQFDPYSFLSPVPSGHQNNDAKKKEHSKPNSGSLKREHSLSFSESELQDEVGDFTDPFEGDDQHLKEDDVLTSRKHATTIQMWELPYTTPNDPFPSPHVTPPARGLSFEGIGTIPSGHFLGSRKSSVASSGDRDKATKNEAASYTSK